jgi:hypothetical protein
MKSYWDSLAGQFQHQQSPLRPCAEDVRIFQGIIHDWHQRHPSRPIKVLLFGVTPEITGLTWPENTFLLAVEKSPAMIDAVWPGNIAGQRQVIQGDWFDVPVEKHSFDFVIGDGFTTALAYPNQYQQIAETISQWLQPEGRLLARLFTRVEKKETHAAILADLQARRIKRFDILKWRLAMMLQENVRQGVVVDEIYRAWNRIENQWPSLVEAAGWPRPTVNTIRLYAGRMDRYAFPTVRELSEAFSPCLESVSTTIPGYDFGECCPILVYRRAQPAESKKTVDARSQS